MQKFDKSNIKELKTLIYNSNAHDAKLKHVNYEHHNGILKIEAFNPIFNIKINFTFYNVELSLSIKNNYVGDRETILSLTVEDDFSYLQNYIKNDCINATESLYLLFQMFSGDELHIVAKEVIAEITESYF